MGGLFFAGDDRFDVVQLVEGSHWREVVDVGVEDFIANLAQHRIVELEKRQLHAALPCIAHFAEVSSGVGARIVGFQLLQNFVGALDDDRRQPCEFCHMDSEAVFASAFHQFADENHFAVYFFDRHVVVDNAFERFFHFVQFVVVGGKQRLGAKQLSICDILNNGPCNA